MSKLSFDLENKVKVTKIYTYKSMTLKMRSGSPKSNQLAITIYLCKIEEDPFAGSKDIPFIRL